MKWTPGSLTERAQFFYTIARRGEAIFQILSSSYSDLLLADKITADAVTAFPRAN